MRRALALAFAVALFACSPKTSEQQVVAATVAHVGVGVGDVLKRAYDDQGLDVIAKATTRSDAEAGLAKLRARWKPIWDAWDLFAHNEALYAACAGEQQCSDVRVLADLKDSWCLLGALAKDVGVQVPQPLQVVCTP